MDESIHFIQEPTVIGVFSAVPQPLLPYMKVSFGTQVPKLNFRIILNQHKMPRGTFFWTKFT
jgi:hypothetical protein